MRTEGVPEPEILDVVDAPGDRDCQMWTGEDPAPCEADAEYLFVYDGSSDPSTTVPRNAFTCSDCFTPPEDVLQERGRVDVLARVLSIPRDEARRLVDVGGESDS